MDRADKQASSITRGIDGLLYSRSNGGKYASKEIIAGNYIYIYIIIASTVDIH